MSPKLLNILLVLIPLVAYYGFFEPLYTGKPGIVWTPESSIRALQSTHVSYINANNLVSEATSGIKKINDNYKAISATTTKKVETMLPDTIDRFKLRNEVLAIADSAGVSITNIIITDDARVANKDAKAFLVTFGVKARYADLKKLFQEYEKSTRFYSIDKMAISLADSKGLSQQEMLNFDKEALVTTVSYKVYYLK